MDFFVVRQGVINLFLVLPSKLPAKLPRSLGYQPSRSPYAIIHPYFLIIFIMNILKILSKLTWKNNTFFT